MGLIERLQGERFAPQFAGLMDVASDIDPIASAGSLMLVDPAHPVTPWAPGVPASGDFVPNLFAAQVEALIGPPSAGSHGGALSYAGLTGAGGLIERTTKGGLHAAISQTNDVIGNHCSITVPNSGLWTYIRNSGHRIYYSLWARRTRAATAVGSTVIGNLAAGTRFIGGFTPEATLSADTGALARPASNAVGPTFRNVGAISTLAGDTEPAHAGNRSAFTVGNFASANRADGRRGLGGSAVFYRLYIEDLTVSGRSYARVDALDYALYQREVLTAGGRYSGDSFTPPPA